ncbi:DUF418 domain-containing protein [Salinispirillum marinum]|uniref:DUF418 domain-containing protein n=2 Tax=Saccharospirillaceae TaxID=255527 RepID=A0ABV8BI84_9GAMM
MAERIESLDLIRGVAILGILFMNIMAMATPIEAYYSPFWREGLSGLEVPLYHLQSLVFESRFMSMFSLLFGVGLYIQYQSALAKDLPARARLFSRLRWLLLFGLLHGFLLFVGDILTLYACCGFLLVWLLGMSNKKQFGLALLFLVLGQLLMLSLVAAVFFKGVPMVMSEVPLSPEALSALQQTWTSYPDRLMAQAADFGQFLLFIPAAALWHNTGLMLIGILLYKKGFFHQSRFIPWGLASLVLGLALGWWVQQLRAEVGFSSDVGFATMLLMMLTGLLSAIGYCSLLVLAATSGNVLVRLLKNAGKMAFTLYISQSVLTYLIFVWLVPQYWGQLGRPELLSLVVGLTVLQLWFASFWQQKYGQGPLEKGWRYLAYRRFRQVESE